MKSPIALITGGSRGIGAAICEQLAADGYTVIVNYTHSKAKAEALAKRLKGKAIQADVANDAQVAAMFKTIQKEFGRLDALVTSAGVAVLDDLATLNRTDFMKNIEINVWGTANCVHHASKLMKQGSIVCISSTCARHATPDALAYAASKAGVEAFMVSSTSTLAPKIRINVVAPGVLVSDYLTMVIANAGNAKTGTLVLYVMNQ